MQQHSHPAQNTPEASRPAPHPHLLEQLAPDENVLAMLPVDLSQQLQFAAGCVALTNRRLLASTCQAQPTAVPTWHTWALHATLALRQFDHGGIATLELHDAHQRLASWRYTLRQHDPAQRDVA